MAEDTDFSSLYRELGITHACTPEEFRHAYRRRVAQLHPDQRGCEGDTARLQELNRLHDAAVRFLRTHGRLPGASHPRAAPGQPASPPPDSPAADAFAKSAVGAPDGDKAGSERYLRYFVLIAVLTIVVSTLRVFDRPGDVQDPAPGVRHEITATDAQANGMIALGMGKEQVKAIQGAPLGSHAIRWDYGPSWVDFSCGDVVTDWYSSPLRPLRVDTPHPTAKDWDKFDAKPPAGC